MLIAQITDTHIKPEGQISYGHVDTAAFLERAVAHVIGLKARPDMVLMTGDLVDSGAPVEYARLRALIAPLDMPVHLIPGNHDSRGPLRAAFPGHGYLPADGFLHYVVETPALRLIALDTLVEGASHGALCDARLDWLEARLAESARPTVLFMHHPPFDCGIAAMDRERLLHGAERLADIVRRHPNVERALCGHVHRPIQTRWAGTIASTAPSSAHQITLDLDPAARLTYIMEPPAVALHRWDPAGGLASHLSYIGDFGGPRSFR